MPHPDKLSTGGEDAYIVSYQYFSHSSFRLIGVLDGVGGWATHGVDSGLYSKGLAEKISELFSRYKHNTSMLDVFSSAAQSVKHKGSTYLLHAK